MGRTRKKIENCRLSPANETYNSSRTLRAIKGYIFRQTTYRMSLQFDLYYFDNICYVLRISMLRPVGYDCDVWIIIDFIILMYFRIFFQGNFNILIPTTYMPPSCICWLRSSFGQIWHFLHRFCSFFAL